MYGKQRNAPLSYRIADDLTDGGSVNFLSYRHKVGEAYVVSARATEFLVKRRFRDGWDVQDLLEYATELLATATASDMPTRDEVASYLRSVLGEPWIADKFKSHFKAAIVAGCLGPLCVKEAIAEDRVKRVLLESEITVRFSVRRNRLFKLPFGILADRTQAGELEYLIDLADRPFRRSSIKSPEGLRLRAHMLRDRRESALPEVSQQRFGDLFQAAVREVVERRESVNRTDAEISRSAVDVCKLYPDAERITVEKYLRSGYAGGDWVNDVKLTYRMMSYVLTSFVNDLGLDFVEIDDLCHELEMKHF